MSISWSLMLTAVNGVPFANNILAYEPIEKVAFSGP
jgi:hypothetical protein